MNHHPVFSEFSRTKVSGTGKHVFDFLGVATNVAFKEGMEQHALNKGSTFVPSYPPLNEHYFDWIALLQSVKNADDTFRMVELGSGWAPWLVRSAIATKQIPSIKRIELLGIEADPTHFAWAKKHFLENDLFPSKHSLIHGALAAEAKTLKFPKLTDPKSDYGASYLQVYGNRDYIQVRGYTLESLLTRLDGIIDFVHADVQGAEYDVFPANMSLLEAQVKRIMIGTHISTEKHQELRHLFLQRGWNLQMDFARMATTNTEFGPVEFGDGFLCFLNPKLAD